MPSAYLGKFGSDEVAAYNQKILHELGIDISHCRHFEGENGFAMVTLKGNDRVFLGSNKGGVAKEHSFDFTQEDLEYIKGFNLIYTNLNSYIEEDLPFLHTAGVPIAYDFSTRWTDAYLEKVCPYVTVAILSCAHLSAEDRAREMQKAADHGVSIVLGTIGEDGSYVLYNGKTYYASAVHADDVIDTMGAGDSYFAAFLCSLLKSSKSGWKAPKKKTPRICRKPCRSAQHLLQKCAPRKAHSATEPPSWDALNCKIEQEAFS